MKSPNPFVAFIYLVLSTFSFADDCIKCSVLLCPEQNQYIPYETVSISYIVTNHTDEVQVLQGLCFPIVRYSVGANGAWHTYTPPSLIQAEPPPPSTTSLAPHMSLQGTFSMDLLDGDSHLFSKEGTVLVKLVYAGIESGTYPIRVDSPTTDCNCESLEFIRKNKVYVSFSKIRTHTYILDNGTDFHFGTIEGNHREISVLSICRVGHGVNLYDCVS